MLTFLFAWSFLSIAACWRDERTLWLVNLHAFYLYTHCLPSFSWPTETPLIPCAYSATRRPANTCKREFSDKEEEAGLHGLLWSNVWHRKHMLSALYHTGRMHVCIQFNLLMGLRGLQPDALMIIFCKVVVMVWPQRQQLLCCLHTPLDQFGCVYFAAVVIIYQETARGGESLSGWHINVYLHHG